VCVSRVTLCGLVCVGVTTDSTHVGERDQTGDAQDCHAPHIGVYVCGTFGVDRLRHQHRRSHTIYDRNSSHICLTHSHCRAMQTCTHARTKSNVRTSYIHNASATSSSASCRDACNVCPSCHRNSVDRSNARGRISNRTTFAHWLRRKGRSLPQNEQSVTHDPSLSLSRARLTIFPLIRMHKYIKS
jgi:hypothetical protein